MWLTVSSGLGARTTVEVIGERFLVGRGEDCDLVLDDERVSREHAYLEVSQAGTAELYDLGSSNGTWVDGERVSGSVVLRGGERLRLGQTTLLCSLTEPRPVKETVIDPISDAPTQMGRSTIFRFVRDAVASESQTTKRRVRVAMILGGAGLAAAMAAGTLFATGTIGGGEEGPSITALERATVLISGLDADGNVEYIGSGSIVRPDGLILTNAHIGAPSAPGLPVQYGIATSKADPVKLQVALFDGEAKPAKPTYFATSVAYDGYIDAAVLKITETLDGKPVSGLDLPTVPVGRSDELRDGEPVTVVGYPGAGGGFEGQINVSRGTVSGFQRDSHIDTPRGWIKTDAELLQGNSGGLAADSSGSLIGIPSRIQCGSSLFGKCLPGLDTQGKIRPIDLAAPVIRAAEGGREWKTPYVVAGTGNERFRFIGWAAEPPDAGCSYRRVTHYLSGASSYTAVYEASGMTAGEDFAFLKTHSRDATAEPAVQQELKRWPATFGPTHSCYWVSFPAFRGDGRYTAQVFAGPRLRPVSAKTSVTLGASRR